MAKRHARPSGRFSAYSVAHALRCSATTRREPASRIDEYKSLCALS
jgi:hypothetical protein